MAEEYESCIIKGCQNRSGSSIKSEYNDNNRSARGIKFFGLPPKTSNGENQFNINDLSTRRRLAWCMVINRKGITMLSCEEMPWIRVCSRHFKSGTPAALTDTNNPDWIPNQNLPRIPGTASLPAAAGPIGGGIIQETRAPPIVSTGGLPFGSPAVNTNLNAGQGQNPAVVQGMRNGEEGMRTNVSPLSPRTGVAYANPSQGTVHSNNGGDNLKQSSPSAIDDFRLPSEAQFLEVPVMNHVVRLRLLSMLIEETNQPSYKADENNPVAILSTTYSKNSNLIRWTCRDYSSGSMRFAYRTNLVRKPGLDGEEVEIITVESDEDEEEEDEEEEEEEGEEEEESSDESGMSTLSLPIVCEMVEAVLHLSKFFCPGISHACIELNSILLTPGELIQMTCPHKTEDWLDLITLTDGTSLGSLLYSGLIEFKEHSNSCTGLCSNITRQREVMDTVDNGVENQDPRHDAFRVVVDMDRCDYAEDQIFANAQQPDHRHEPPGREKPMKQYSSSRCCAPNCDNSRFKVACRGMSFYKLPLDEFRCKVWIQNMGRKDLLHMTALELRKLDLKLCSVHFSDDMYKSPNDRKHLNCLALPTLFDRENNHIQKAFDEKNTSMSNAVDENIKHIGPSLASAGNDDLKLPENKTIKDVLRSYLKTNASIDDNHVQACPPSFVIENGEIIFTNDRYDMIKKEPGISNADSGISFKTNELTDVRYPPESNDDDIIFTDEKYNVKEEPVDMMECEQGNVNDSYPDDNDVICTSVKTEPVDVEYSVLLNLPENPKFPKVIPVSEIPPELELEDPSRVERLSFSENPPSLEDPILLEDQPISGKPPCLEILSVSDNPPQLEESSISVCPFVPDDGGIPEDPPVLVPHIVEDSNIRKNPPKLLPEAMSLWNRIKQ